MRQVADGFIGELSFNYANGMYILGANSSTKTSLDIISNKIGVEPYNEKDAFGASTGGAAVAKDKNSRTIMLARNSKTKEKDLTDYTKISIKNAHEKGAEFVVGDMPNVDSQFIDYLQEIGAKFTIYHTGNESRIKTQEQPIVEENVTNNQNTQEQGNEFTPEDLGLNTDSNQNDAVCK